MLTLFGVPRPFHGHIGVIQRNALASWARLSPRPRIILFGTREGTEEAAARIGAEWQPEVGRNESGTPLVSDLFRRAEAKAGGGLLCYANSDIVLTGSWLRSVERAWARWRRFLMVGECTDLDVDSPIDYDRPDWEAALRRRAAENGAPRGRWALDYFVFTPGLFGEIPPMVVGRGRYDNWLMWRARQRRMPVLDASAAATAIHQNHSYAHIPGGRQAAHFTGPEARRNLALAGGKRRLYNLDDATHRLTPIGIRRDFEGTFRFRAAWARLVFHKRTLRRRLRLLARSWTPQWT